MVAIIVSMSTYAQGNEEWFYYEWTGFEELLPGKPFTYRYVEALDDASEKSLNDLYANMKDACDKSILMRSKGGWYVKNNYSLPEGNYYESAFHKKYLHEDNGIIYIIRPIVTITLRKGCQIDGLLEYFGDKVTLDHSEGYGESPTQYWLTFHMSTSKEVLEAISQWYDIDQSSIISMRPKTYELFVDYDSYLISVLTDNTGDNDEDDRKLITEMDWEGVRYDVIVEIGPSPWETTDEGLAITVPSEAEPWNPMTNIAYNFSLEKGHNYIVRLTMKAPHDGTYHVGLGEFGGAWYSCEVPVTASNDFQTIEVKCPDFPGDVREGMLLLGCGKVVGTTVVKKVQIYDVKDSNSKETGIEDVKTVNTKKVDGAIYNLAGQKVNASYKGIVIKNGKRYVLK